MRRIAVTSAFVIASAAAADVWSPMEFYMSLGTPKAGDTQQAGARWTFRTGAFNGPLMAGFDPTLICEQGFGLWGTLGGPYGFIPNVGPRTSPDEDLDQSAAPFTAEFDGLIVIPSNESDGCLVFTAPETMSVPPLTLRAELLYSGSNGVLVSVRTRIAGQTAVWLDQAFVPGDNKGFQEWRLFENEHPVLQKGDKLWVQVNANSFYDADWANISLESDACYADCTGEGTLDLFDFLCFVNAFNGGEEYADCDGNGVRDLFDFLCFVNTFNAGC